MTGETTPEVPETNGTTQEPEVPQVEENPTVTPTEGTLEETTETPAE